MERLTEKLKSGAYVPKAPLYTMCDKLGAYEDLEEQNKLLKLPCALGDWVYVIKKNGDIDLHKVVAIEIDEDGAYCKSSYRFGKLEDFGKTIFFSEEEAEAAKREMN